MDKPPLRPLPTDFFAGQRFHSEWEEKGALKQLAMQFHHSSNPVFFADGMWIALNRFRTHMVDGDLWEPSPIRSAIRRLMELGRQHQLIPSDHPFDSFIVSKVQFQAGKPSVASMPKDDEYPAVAMIEAGPEGLAELFDLDRCFISAPGRRAAIRWAESWIRAREVQLQPTGGGVPGSLDTYRPAEWIDEATEGIYDENRLRKMRENGTIRFRKRGPGYLYCVRSLIEAAPELQNKLLACLNNPDFQPPKRKVKEPKPQQSTKTQASGIKRSKTIVRTGEDRPRQAKTVIPKKQ